MVNRLNDNGNIKIQLHKAKNEEDAIEKMTYDNWDDCEILSSEIDTEEV